MNSGLLHVLHQAFFGGIAAAGFGILFNFGWRELPWCVASGAVALATRTVGQEAGWNLEAASFAAAVAVRCAGQFFHARLGVGTDDMAVAGCIPMVPGAFAAEGIFGLYDLTGPHPHDPASTVVTAMEFTLRAIFTIGALGTGLAITKIILNKPRLRNLHP